MENPTLLLTRPLAQSRAFLEGVTALLGHVPDHLISPVTEIEAIPVNVEFGKNAEIVLTSAQALSFLPKEFDGQNRLAWCVGPVTAQAARSLGFRAESAAGGAENLAEMISRRVGGRNPLIYLRGETVSFDLAAYLRVHDVPVDEVVTYRQIPSPLSDAAHKLLRAKTVALPLFSYDMSRRLKDEISENYHNLRLIAISEAVAKPWSGTNIPLRLAERPNRDAMMRAVVAEL